MFDMHQHPADETPAADALPHHAVRALRACSQADHAQAKRLRERSTDQNGISHKLRAARLRSGSEQAEDRARDLADQAHTAERTSRFRLTDLGREARCSKCKTYWPADSEFFYMRGTTPHSWCKACYVHDRITKGTTGRTGTGKAHNDHVLTGGVR